MAYDVGYYTVYFFFVLKSGTFYIFSAQHKEAFQLVLSESTWSSFTTRVIDRVADVRRVSSDSHGSLRNANLLTHP
jgi:hypothetical protein